MKKQIILRSFFGFPIGIAIGYCITIVISLIWAGGYYSPCVPDLVSAMGSEINGVLVQALLTGLMGAGFGACSVIWKIERWSIVKQTGVYFSIISVIMMPIAYLLYWMDHSIQGFIVYFGIFVFIFVTIWVIQFAIGKYTVKKMNANLHQVKKERR